jgi:hypothetical protein
MRNNRLKHRRKVAAISGIARIRLIIRQMYFNDLSEMETKSNANKLLRAN